jgi:HK97 gp10 family phage protein
MIAKVKITGLREMQRTLDRLPRELIKSSESAVLRAGAKPIEKAAKAKVPVGTGLLKKSIGNRVKKVDGSTSARIGPRTGFKGRSLGMKKNKAGVASEKFADPNKYSHLVEFGSSRSPAQPFIRPAIKAAQSQVMDAMAAGLDKHLTRTAARLARKGKK